MKFTNKDDYRLYFANVKDTIKIKYFLKQNSISQANFSHFMKSVHYDHLISLDKLDSLKNSIKEYFEKIV